jgi:hypothetical protein
MTLELGSSIEIAQNEKTQDIKNAINVLVYAMTNQAEWCAATNFARVDALHALSTVRDLADAAIESADTRHYLNPGDIVRFATPKRYGRTPAGGQYTSRFGVIRKLNRKSVAVSLLKINTIDVFVLAEPDDPPMTIKYDDLKELIFNRSTGQWRGACDAAQAKVELEV